MQGWRWEEGAAHHVHEERYLQLRLELAHAVERAVAAGETRKATFSGWFKAGLLAPREAPDMLGLRSR